MKTTNSVQHTPGPWKLNGSQVTANGDWKSPVCVVVSKADHRPTVDAAAHNMATAEANARLISAAPDLLAALESAASQFDFIVSAMAKGQTVSLSSLQNCAANARAAIAKAEGR